MVTTKRGSIADQKSFDRDTQVMMFEGCSLSQLAQIFSMDVKKVKAKLHGLAPVSTRAGHPIYSIKEAARRLVEPIWPIEEYVKHMNHTDLPVMLRKEYWAGQRSQQIYQIAAGELWPTDQVIEHITELLKTISISLRLTSDSVERETSLTPKQRNIVIRMMDEALANAHSEVEKKLKRAKARKMNPEDLGADDGRSTAVAVEDDEDL